VEDEEDEEEEDELLLDEDELERGVRVLWAV